MNAVIAAAAASGAAAAAAFALGYLILEPSEFLKLLEKMEKPIVLYMVKREGILSKKDMYTYVAKYGEFTILTKTETPLTLPSKAELIPVKDIVLPPHVELRLDSIAKGGSSATPHKH